MTLSYVTHAIALFTLHTKNNETYWLVMIGGDWLKKGAPNLVVPIPNQSQLVSLANDDILE
jgi:hypothetical protein